MKLELVESRRQNKITLHDQAQLIIVTLNHVTNTYKFVKLI